MVKLRLAALGLSIVVCTGLTYIAATHRISGIGDLIDLSKSIKVELEKKKPPPPPPPPPPPDKPPPPPPPPPPPTTIAPVTVDIPVTPPTPPAPPAAAQITNPTWIKRPSAGEYDRYYPERARDRAKGGRVVLNCTVQANGRINCTVASESPEGWGFGKAALDISRFFQMSPKLENGTPSEGGRIAVPIVFQISE